ncbi:MAG TPA: polysaccharide biosynthesis tyrosine autokinase [Armatimonadota bacterium]|nr:polysaccharide biosynthesis tyrosine autokinase [Armatimonadota bacterium]
MTTADFWRIYRIISHRKWLIAAVVGCAMLVVGVGVLVMPRYYRATALVMPSEQALQKSVIGGGGPDGGYNLQAREERLSNLIYLAQSEAVIARAAQAQHITEPPKKLGRRITVDTLPRTAIIRIIALDRDSGRSVGLANSLASALADFYRELSHREAAENRAFLERELASVERELRKAEEELADFRSAAGGTGADLRTAEPVISPAESDRDSAEAQLRETTARLAAARARLGREAATMVTEEGTTDNPVVTKLRGDLADLEIKLAGERAVHTDQHPNVVALTSQISDLRRRLADEMGHVITHTTVARNPLHDSLAAQVVELETGAAALQARLLAMNRIATRERSRYAVASARGVELASLTRNYRIADETYARLRAAVDQARVDEKVSNDAGAIQIVDLARAADGPVTRGPSPWQLLALGFALSLAVAFGLALAMDVLDDRVKTTDDVMRLLNLPVTGIIPAMEGVRVRELPLITRALPSSPYAEAYRFLRTDLLFTCEDQPLQTLCVVTPKPGQGGTTTIANLAIALAEADRRVILVDADLRRPSLHAIFGLPNEVGLTSVVGGGVKLADALQVTDVPNLVLLTAGPPAHNPSNLISSNRMRALMRELREHCDFVLFDTPSAIAFSDAAIIASMTDGALMVVRARQPLRGSQLQVTSLLNKARANVIGVVLNDVAPEDAETTYFYAHYYASPQLAEGESPPLDAARDGAALHRRGGPEPVEGPPPALPAGEAAEAAAADESMGADSAAGPSQGPGAADTAEAAEEVAEEMATAAAVEEAPPPLDAARDGAALHRRGGPEPVEGPAPAEEPGSAQRRSRRRWFTGAFSLLLLGTVGYLFAAGMGYVRLPGATEKQRTGLRAIIGGSAVSVVADVRQPTSASVKADGKVLFDGLLAPGHKRWRAGEEVTVWLERPEAVTFTQNGQLVGSLGRRGSGPMERTFTPSR